MQVRKQQNSGSGKLVKTNAAKFLMALISAAYVHWWSR